MSYRWHSSISIAICCNRVPDGAFERLEPYAMKVTPTVLRGARVSNGFGLPDISCSVQGLGSWRIGHSLI